MTPTRRQIVIGGLSLGAAALLKGCATGKATSTLPGAPFPDLAERPTADVRPGYSAPTSPAGEIGGVIARSGWTRAQPIASRVNPMSGVSRITCHHEGATDSPVYFTDQATTAERIELIRKFHLSRGWGDIGYHYIIDRAGRVWQGRPVSLQGAHVKDENEHNVGVMCLGNFDIQSPSNAQLAALRKTVRDLHRQYNVPVPRIYTHQELRSTACPGRAMQPKVAAMRSSGQFA